MKPTVSVIIPFYNRHSEIAATLKSLEAQTCGDWELVLVDDASVESPEGLVRDLLPERRTKVIRHNSNSGPSAARNTGIENASGDFVAFLDSDDIWLPRKLEVQLAAITRKQNPDHAFCVTRTRVLSDGDTERSLPARTPEPKENFGEFLYCGHGFAQTSSFLLARCAAQKIRFADDLRQYEDHLFFISAGAQGLEYLLCEEPLVIWHNDDRSDRLGRTDDLQRADRFLELAGPLMTEKARLAFQTRYIGQQLFRLDPASALRTFGQARMKGAVSSRDLLTLAMRCALPRDFYTGLRRSLLGFRPSGKREGTDSGVAFAYEFRSSPASAGSGSGKISSDT